MTLSELLVAVLLAILAALLFVSCSTPPTPEQITAYSNVVHNGAQDYKDVVYATHRR